MKEALLAALRARVEEDLVRAEASQREAQAAINKAKK